MFGEWLRQQRELRRLTREEFVERIGCSVSTLRMIEKGERRPSRQIAELMANALDIPPAEQGTFVKVARGEWNVERLVPASNQPPRPDTPPPNTNLPVLPTPLIGRQREVEKICSLLGDPQCRLLTLVGPGGIGKTRLAIEAASRIQNEFSDGVVFVPFAPVNSSRFIIPVIASSIGFTFQSENRTEPRLQLLSHLKEKQMLLLADNLEHLLKEPDIELFSELLAAAPGVKLLMTSRAPLDLQVEWVFEVQGLPVPKDLQTETIVQGTCIELFIQRARRAHAGFSAESRDLSAIARICQLVDGNPLGIELAAVWVRTLSCGEIAHEIERGLDILHVSARDLPARHRSMRAVFEHSWELLNEEERQVLARLSIFRGGFRREATEQIAKATLATLSALVTRSLVRRGDDGRYHLHELIRQYAAIQLANYPEEQTTTQTRHSDYYLTFFGNADERLRSPAQSEALCELTLEIDNFHVAWDCAVSQGQFGLIEQTLRSLAMLCDARGWRLEGLDAIDFAIDALETAHRRSLSDRTNQVALAHLLATRSFIAYGLAQQEQARVTLERSLEILRPLNEPRVAVEATTMLGVEMLKMGNYDRALELLAEGREIAISISDRWFAALCLTEKAKLFAMIDNAEKAYEQIRFAVAEWRAIGDPRFTAFGLIILSQSASALGRYDEARITLEESITLNDSVGDRWGLGSAYRGLGLVAQAQGKHTQAVEMFRKGMDIFNELGMPFYAAQGLSEIGWSFFALGDDTEARRVWGESLRTANETKAIFIALDAIVGLASLQAKQGNLAYALELFLIVLNHPAGLQETKNRCSDLRAKVEAQLAPTEIETIQVRAAEKKLEMVVEDLIR